MKLNQVEIRNFRSIKEAVIEFDPSCRILVGINESGKSNILKALSLLGNYELNKTLDLREILPDEDEIKEGDSYVRFIFMFNKKETDRLRDDFISTMLTDVKNPTIIEYNSNEENANNLFRNEAIYDVDIINKTKTVKYWSLEDDKDYRIKSGWKKPTSACPDDYIININEQGFTLKDYKLVYLKKNIDIPDEYLEDAEINDLNNVYGNAVIKIAENNLPQLIFWEYSENNLLPNSVNIVNFSNNPDICIPLKNMFILAGIDNIKESINQNLHGSTNRITNFLDRIANKTTDHFRSVWKEYGNVEFSLKINADEIIPGIKEVNTHDFIRRSDGFKKFVTFLLMVSVNVKIKKLQNTILLIDEPETSLHPSGARYLRDELINIAKSNYVVYSTHSIFMIDPSDISRHYIVNKQNEITRIKEAETANLADEELLYNALGYSTFETLKPKNILVEGWRDKQLLNIAIKNSSADIMKKLNGIGICHGNGVKSFKAITPILELAKRECMLLSDSDAPAKEKQREYKKEKCYGQWYTYQDIDTKIKAITGEDFISNDYILDQLKLVAKDEGIPEFSKTLPEKTDKLKVIKNWLTDIGFQNDHLRDALDKIKNSIFDNLHYQNIEIDEYIILLNGICKKLGL